MAPAKDSARVLTYAFLNLPYHVRIQIVRDLGLVKGKTPMNEADFFAKCFRKAKTDKKLADLWDAVSKEIQDPDKKLGENPYKTEDVNKAENPPYEAFEENLKSVTAGLIEKAGKTGEVQSARLSTNGWRDLADGKGRIKIESIEVTITPTNKTIH